MACSLAGLFASRATHPVATTYCRFFSLKHEGKCTPEVRDLFKKAICPRLSATTSLARLLNLMDNRIGVKPAACPRWDVIEDIKALYITRDLSGLPHKDIVARLEVCDRYGIASIDVSFAYDHMWFNVGQGSQSTYLYPFYSILIETPEEIYRPRENIVMDVKAEVLKITIPKKKGKWIRNITTEYARFCGLQNEDSYYQMVRYIVASC